MQIIVRAIPCAGARRSHLRLRSWFSNVYFRPSNRLSEPTGSISIALKSREQGTLFAPCARSAEYFLCPVTVHSIVPCRHKNSEHTHNTFRGKCPMIVPSFFTATVYRLEGFSGSLSHTNDSPTTSSILLYICGSLGKSFWQQLLSLYVSSPCLACLSLRARPARKLITLSQSYVVNIFVLKYFRRTPTLLVTGYLT